MQVPFIDLSRLTREIAPAVLKDWEKAIAHSEFVGGQPVQLFEARLAQLLGARHVVACASGTDALMIALAARGVRRGDRVAIPNCTFWATYEAVVQVGAEPVLLDIDPEDLQLSFPALVEAHSRFGLRAAILVHAFGWATARLEEFRAFCDAQQISLIEDAAQAFGVEHAGASIFRDAQIATLSFYPAKVIGGSQDGGALLTNDERLAAQLRSLANHGRRDHFSYDRVGWNSRLGAPNAYFLLRVLERADSILDCRRRTAAYYRSELADVPGLTLVGPPRGVRENGYLSVALSSLSPSALVQGLASRGVACGRVWPETIDAQKPALNALRLEPLEHSREFAKRVFNLPLFYGITDVERRIVVQQLRAVLSAEELVTR
jgi:UDP-2-acetamido-2-deoxy-ribo-hexuluronate aminotransferase